MPTYDLVDFGTARPPPSPSITNPSRRADEAQRMHSEIYPRPFTAEFNRTTLSVAAAFEAMHHWEHDRRLKGEPIKFELAKSQLADVVKSEARRLITAKPWEIDDLGVVRDLADYAFHEASYLYDKHYGMDDWNDPEKVNAHVTMAGVWPSWESDE